MPNSYRETTWGLHTRTLILQAIGQLLDDNLAAIMSNGKGKGRAKVAEEAKDEVGATKATSTSNSVIDRVAASAIGLTRSAFGAPSSTELGESATAASATSGKGQPSGVGGSSAWVESSRLSEQQGPSGAQQSVPTTFRSSHREQHIASVEAEFSSFLDGIDSFAPSTEANLRPLLDDEHTGSLGSANPLRISSRDPEPLGFRTVKEQEGHDGEAVLGILSDRTLEADSFPPQNIEDEIEEWRLTDEQVAMFQRLTKELFPSTEIHATTDVSDPLNLQPNAFRSEDTSTWLPDEYAQDSYSHFGQVVPQAEASRLWIDQWEGVLTRYADEVWGGLLPLVKDAREEIEEMKAAGDVADHRPKALRRLGLVLAHFKT